MASSHCHTARGPERDGQRLGHLREVERGSGEDVGIGQVAAEAVVEGKAEAASGSGGEGVFARSADHLGSAAADADRVVTIAAVEDVAQVAAEERVVAEAAGERVQAAAAPDRVLPVAAVDPHRRKHPRGVDDIVAIAGEAEDVRHARVDLRRGVALGVDILGDALDIKLHADRLIPRHAAEVPKLEVLVDHVRRGRAPPGRRRPHVQKQRADVGGGSRGRSRIVLDVEDRVAAEVVAPDGAPLEGQQELQVGIGRDAAGELEVEQVQRGGEVVAGELDHLLEREPAITAGVGRHHHVDVEEAVHAGLGRSTIELSAEREVSAGFDLRGRAVDKQPLLDHVEGQRLEGCRRQEAVERARRGARQAGARCDRRLERVDPEFEPGRVHAHRERRRSVHAATEGHGEGRSDRVAGIEAKVGREGGEGDREQACRLAGEHVDQRAGVEHVEGDA